GGFFFGGMTLPDYHVGDQVNPGSSIAEVIDLAKLELSAQVEEIDRMNMKAGQTVEITLDALPGEKFTGKVRTIGGATSRMFWDDNAKHKFDVMVALDRLDERLRPGFAARLSILGDQISHAVSIPEIGRASCRERVEIWVVAVVLKKKKEEETMRTKLLKDNN